MKYDWRRFWYPLEEEIFFGRDGFPFVPESGFSKSLQPDTGFYESISNYPCLALLGEPGIGKSTAMKDIHEFLKQSIDPAEEELLYINLDEYGDENRLIQELFKSAKFLAWTNGKHILHLFIDSLDECRLRIPHVAIIMVRRLEEVSQYLPRLRLRIACRTADWPVYLNNEFTELWGKDNYKAYKLAPLTREEVLTAAKANQIDTDGFFSGLERTETIPLAIIPITLELLLSEYKQHGQLPKTRQELYELGCKSLCAEYNSERRSSNNIGTLSPEQRMAIASRIAAVNIFCRKPIINTNPIGGTQANEEIHISHLLGEKEGRTNEAVDVSLETVREVLGNGLFSSRGSYRLGFAHQTYIEFLASRYLLNHEMDEKKIMSLLTHSDNSHHIVPQLSETAAWVAGQNENILIAIANIEPQILLRADAGLMSAHNRKMIIDAILNSINNRESNNRDWVQRGRYIKLNHGDLAAQLQPWLSDKTKQTMARGEAIAIAEACNVTNLQSVLADLALDSSEPIKIRVSAAGAISYIADDKTRLRLKPLAMNPINEDECDELKGTALRALWPKHISAEELFEHLPFPKHRNFYGPYHYFLGRILIQHLNNNDLPHALAWVKDLIPKGGHEAYFYGLPDKIIIQAWINLQEPSILQLLAEIYIECCKNHRELINARKNLSAFEDVECRRMLAGKVIEMSQDQDIWDGLMYWPPILITQEDFDWCIEQLLASVGETTEPKWAELVWHMYFMEPDADATRLDKMIHVRKVSQHLKEKSEGFFTPVELGSEQAAKAKEYYELITDRRERHNPKPLEWLPKDRIEYWLCESENGKSEAWNNLLEDLTLEDTSTHYEFIPSDVRTLPGWINSMPSTKERILRAAKRYLQEGPVDTEKWLRETRKWKISDISAYIALFLLKQEASDVYGNLPGWVWERHVANVLCYPKCDIGNYNKQEHEAIALRCYQHAKSEVLRYLPLQIDAEDKEDVFITCVDKLEQCWDDDLRQVVYDKLVDEQNRWRHETFRKIAGLLLSHDHLPTRDLLLDMVASVTKDTRSNITQSEIAAECLMRHESDAAWSIIWPAVVVNRDFGRNVLMKVVSGYTNKTIKFIARKLTEDQLTNLSIWLVKEFPLHENPVHEEIYSPSEEDNVWEFWSKIISYFSDIATPASIAALEKIYKALQSDWMRLRINHKRKVMLRNTWRPLKPEELIQLATQPKSKIIQSADQLQSLLIETLWVLDQNLQGETSASMDLWNQNGTQKQKTFRPKDENDFSNWLKRQLETELKNSSIVVAREVQIRRGTGNNPGETTDIYVTALVTGLTENTSDKVTVIIEVKGCWNNEVNKAMEAQLVNRYLKDNQCKYGIYIVGWYMCDQWSNDDSRKSTTPKFTLNQARDYFENQANELSSGGVSVKSFVLNIALR